MRRIRWFIVKWSKSFNDIYDAISADQYVPGENFGFQIEKFRDNRIIGRYIERREYNEIIEDPFGNIAEVSRYTFDITNFTLSNEPLSIELIDPARKLSAFLSALSKANDNKMILTLIRASVQSWLALLQNKLDGFVVTNIECSGLLLANNVLANFNIKGTQDVRAHLKKLTSGKKIFIDKARFKFIDPLHGFSFAEISQTGSAKIDPKNQDHLLPILKESLTSVAYDLANDRTGSDLEL